MDKPNTREEAFVFFCVFFFLAWSVRWGVFSWFQSATAPLDVTKSFTLDFYFFLYWLASWFQTSSRDNLHVGELTAHQHRQALTVWAFFIYLFIICPVHPSILWSFIHLSNHSSRRKPVPAAPPNGSAIICRRSVRSLLFRHMHVSPKWCQDGVASSAVQHMLRAQSSFPPDDLPPPALMNQDRSETEKGRLVGADKLPLIKFCLFFFFSFLLVLHPSTDRLLLHSPLLSPGLTELESHRPQSCLSGLLPPRVSTARALLSLHQHQRVKMITCVVILVCVWRWFKQ